MEILKFMPNVLYNPIIFSIELGPEIDAGGPSRQFWSNVKSEIEKITKQMFQKDGLQDNRLLDDLSKKFSKNSKISSLIASFSKKSNTNYALNESFFKGLGMAIGKIMFLEIQTFPLIKIPPELRLFLFSSLQLVLDDGYGIKYDGTMKSTNALFEKFLFDFPYGYNINTILKMLTGDEYRQTLNYSKEDLDVIYEMADFEFGEDDTVKYSDETKRRLPFFIHLENQVDPLRTNIQKYPSLLPLQLPYILHGFLDIVVGINAKVFKKYINIIQDLQIDDMDDIFQKNNDPDLINIQVNFQHPTIDTALRTQTEDAIKRSLRNMNEEEKEKVSVFWTGSKYFPKDAKIDLYRVAETIPTGGFTSLQDMSEGFFASIKPNAHTCFNSIELRNYSTIPGQWGRNLQGLPSSLYEDKINTIFKFISDLPWEQINAYGFA